MMEGFKRYLVAATALLVAGCGGGGSSGPAAAPGVFQAQGVAQGTTGQGYGDFAIILETGEFYNFTTASNIVLAVDHGTMNEAGDAYLANLTEFYVAANTVTTGTVTGVFTPQGAITGTTVFNLFQYTSFSANYLASYNTAAALSALAGTYSGAYTYGGSPVTLAVSATGAITGTAPNCAISGTATPRASGKNIFDLSLTLTGANCTPAGVATATGVAALNSVNGSTTLYTAGLNAAGTNGFFWVGTKQ